MFLVTSGIPQLLRQPHNGALGLFLNSSFGPGSNYSLIPLLHKQTSHEIHACGMWGFSPVRGFLVGVSGDIWCGLALTQDFAVYAGMTGSNATSKACLSALKSHERSLRIPNLYIRRSSNSPPFSMLRSP